MGASLKKSFRGLGLLVVDDSGAGVSVSNKYLFIWDTMQTQSGLNIYAQWFPIHVFCVYIETQLGITSHLVIILNDRQPVTLLNGSKHPLNINTE